MGPIEDALYVQGGDAIPILRGKKSTLLYVMATRVREDRATVAPKVSAEKTPNNDAFDAGTAVRGIALCEPVVGRGWVVYLEGSSRRVVTSTVQRVLMLPNQRACYIQTRNSVYRLTLLER